MLPARLSVLLLAPVLAFAIDDLPVYFDAGCAPGATTGFLNNGYAQGPADMALPLKPSTDPKSEVKTVPVTCLDKVSGTDAIRLKLPRKLVSGEYWDYGIKFADDRKHGLAAFKDVHLWIKNNASTPAKFRLGWEAATGGALPMKDIEIPGGGGWKEYVYTLQDVPGDTVYGLKLSHPMGEWNGPDVSADPIDILIDSIVLTDGTGEGTILVPSVARYPVPANWGSKFLLGSFDNREVGKSTKAAQAGMAYRYQYIMPDIRTYYSRSKVGYPYDYAMESESLGVKTAIVWYNLGKSGEGYRTITANLASGTYMADYFDRYDWVLDQLALAGQDDYMIICEPDMYGFLMRGPDGAIGTPVTDPTKVAVDMSKANQLSGKTWAPNMVGWAQYLVSRARQKLTKGVIFGHMPNHWGVNIPGQVGQGRVESHLMSALAIGTFMKGFGPEGLGDVVFVEKTDHDAGHKPSEEDWLWDSTNYAKYFLWTRTIAWKTSLPICGWQVSEGNMSNKKEWQDDAVQTFLDHPEWWMDGGFAGILFGAGNADCVNYLNDLDGGWFIGKMSAYMANAVSLPPLSTPARDASARPGLRCLCRRDGMVLSGWKGEAEATLLDLSGRVLARATVRDGQLLSWPRTGSGMRLVRVRTPDGSFHQSRMIAQP